MNSKFRQLLSPIQYKIYEIWRDDDSGEVNSLNFLILRDFEEPVAEDAQQGAAVNP